MDKTAFVACVLSALTGLASPEDELAAKLPEIFAKAAAHYRAIDAAATPLMKDAKGGMRYPNGWLDWKGKRELDMRPVLQWTAGHFPGSLWYLYEATGEDFFRDRATVWTEILAPNAKVTDNHDIGFVMYCSYGNARRILKTTKYDALLRETAESLCKRYSDRLGLIRSWGELDEKYEFLVIPDNLMNLELLEWAADHNGATNRPRFAEVARSHADVTMKNHFRADGGCFHVLNYDQRPQFLGKVQEIRRGQGLCVGTSWSRGQSWGIYGYTMMYRMTGYLRYLAFARKLADYAIGHPNMPADGIPHWDYGAPGEERDSSAGAIMASALVELSQYVAGADRARYRAFAVKQLAALSSPAYFSEGDEIGHWLLKHGTGHKPGGSQIDTPLNYGDYYYLEALLRFRDLKAREAACAKTAALLPPRATLPADEFALRIRFPSEKALALAEKALAEPIPDTSDELYAEYWTIGNRSHYESRYFARLRNVDALALAEAAEGRGRFLPRLEEYLAAICDMKSWVFPAHDWDDGGRGVWRGTSMSTDLFSSEVGAHLACIVRLLGGRLRPATVARVRTEIERRVFSPVRREALRLFPGREDPLICRRNHWWMDCAINWNAVCWDNIVCAACGLLDDPADRAFFVTAADNAVDRYIGGFTDDGYCSEGMGYWNYGFGHHLLTGRLLNRITGGKYDVFRRPKQRTAAAYARAYTLKDGVSPAFADGNGAASPKLLRLVDEFWPDLPKDLPPASEFANGQVWLFRDPTGLSVAFKGGHNAEHHNHNDVGSYYLIDGDRFVAGDPGREEYTARTFSTNRYESKVLNSYGHPVPVVGGRLQSTGREGNWFRASVVSKDLGGAVATVVLDLTGVYEVETLKKLTRTFVYDRAAKTFTVRDHAEFSAPTAFEDCVVTLEEKDGSRGGAEAQRPDGIGSWCRCTMKGTDGPEGIGVKTREETIENPGWKTPHRFSWAFEKPVLSADVTFEFHAVR